MDFVVLLGVIVIVSAKPSDDMSTTGWLSSTLSTITVIDIFSTVSNVTPLPCSTAIPGKIILQKHEESQKYWKCIGNLAIEEKCDSFLVFNEDKQICEFLNNTNPPWSGGSNPLCLTTGVAYLPHSFDCKTFIKCYLNESYDISCPEGLLFDQYERRCKDPSHAKCAVDPRCSQVKENYYFLSHPTDCEKFIECRDNSSYVYSCQYSYVFSVKKQTCIPKDNVDRRECFSTDYICRGVPENSVVLNQCSCGCNYYWECKGRMASLKVCPKGLRFDEEKQMCLLSTKCQDTTRKPYAWTTKVTTSLPAADYRHPKCADGKAYLFSHPSNLRKFYECNQKNALERECPDGFYFDDKSLTCSNPFNLIIETTPKMEDDYYSIIYYNDYA